MTLDGAIGLPGPRPLRISSDEDMVRVHRLRAASDAILVGIGTVLSDDPKLDVKWKLLGQTGTNPLRVVLDAHDRLPDRALVLDDRAPTLVFNGPAGRQDANHVRVPETRPGRLDLHRVLDVLDQKGIKRLLVEGGRHVLTEFIQSRLLDEMTVYVAPWFLGLADAPRIVQSTEAMPRSLRLEAVDQVGEGALFRFRRADQSS
jgi:2,5-diamino-6-(ribosylamino)-4(3H)-pyrimidinone 5'-phosphate reductase